MLTRISIFQLCFLGVLSGVIAVDDLFGLKITTEKSVKPRENTQYSFRYFVKDEKTGDYKIQEERKEGDSVLGSYTLADPNGDLRKVTYKAGPGTGFEAKVDVQPTASPMKQTAKPVTNVSDFPTTEKLTTVESNFSRFPGGFQMDVSSKSDIKTEMGMEFSLKTSPISEKSTISTSTEESEIPEEVTEPYDGSTTKNSDSSSVENATFAAEVTEDPIQKEIDEALQLPKLPELVLSDNKTHFKFHKDPEEALLDERITQIARQLAETSLRREYEERKLGHFIPISVSSIEPSTTSYLSKSFRFMRNEASSESPSLQALTQVRMVPQYVYQQTLIPDVRATNRRFPIVVKPQQQSITNLPNTLKEDKTSEPNFHDRELSSVTPVHVPTFFQFFTPYIMHTPGSYSPEKTTGTTVKMDNLIKGESPVHYDTTLYAPVTLIKDKTTEKP